jgi:hypothetical protein
MTSIQNVGNSSDIALFNIPESSNVLHICGCLGLSVLLLATLLSISPVRADWLEDRWNHRHTIPHGHPSHARAMGRQLSFRLSAMSILLAWAGSTVVEEFKAPGDTKAIPPQRIAIRRAASALLSLFGIHTAYAHEWYPATCCSGKDCGLVVKKTKTPYGTWVSVERGKAFFPNGWPIMPSGDEHEHACMVPMGFESAQGRGGPIMTPRCWFQPGVS